MSQSDKPMSLEEAVHMNPEAVAAQLDTVLKKILTDASAVPLYQPKPLTPEEEQRRRKSYRKYRRHLVLTWLPRTLGTLLARLGCKLGGKRPEDWKEDW